jgi:hypothetical protein
MLNSWPATRGDGTGAEIRDAGHIASLLGRLGESWSRDPDQRFGQFVENMVRFKLPMDALRLMEDEDFLALLDEWDEEHRK